MKYLISLTLLLFISGCATMGMNTCKETCGLNGVRVFKHKEGLCECYNGIKYNHSFNGRTDEPVSVNIPLRETPKDINPKQQ